MPVPGPVSAFDDAGPGSAGPQWYSEGGLPSPRSPTEAMAPCRRRAADPAPTLTRHASCILTAAPLPQGRCGLRPQRFRPLPWRGWRLLSQLSQVRSGTACRIFATDHRVGHDIEELHLHISVEAPTLTSRRWMTRVEIGLG